MLGILDTLREKMQKTEVYKSVFRHNYQDTQRNRALQIVDNVVHLGNGRDHIPSFYCSDCHGCHTHVLLPPGRRVRIR